MHVCSLSQRYTQYIPLSLYDLQTWVGSPALFVWDCNCAGLVLQSFLAIAERRCLQERSHRAENGEPDEPASPMAASGAASAPPFGYAGASVRPGPDFDSKYCIQLAACGRDEILPLDPELPADLFTACLTTPIKIALRTFLQQNRGRLKGYCARFTPDDIDRYEWCAAGCHSFGFSFSFSFSFVLPSAR